MNEFVEQFLIESREHVEQGTADLLALEKNPHDTAALDSAFRAFHTLKGSAGIVDFGAMAVAVHAAENVLAAVRSGSRQIATSAISDCLACLDQVSRWLDAMQASGEVPTGADSQANAVVRRFAAHDDADDSLATSVHASSATTWSRSLIDKHPEIRAIATTAVRYVPHAACFLDHEDPLARIAALPQLLAVDVEPVTPWPSVDGPDPFVCNVVLTAVTQSSAEDVTASLVEVLARCEILTLTDATAVDEGAIPQPARALLDAQVALLRESGAQPARGRVASAGAVAVNLLRSLRRHDEAAGLARSVDASLREGKPDALLGALAAIVTRGAPPRQRSPQGNTAEHKPLRSLRVDASRIDGLVSLTGELTVARNSIGHIAGLVQAGDPFAPTMLKEAYARLDSLVGELQQFVLGMRVLPLRHVFQRFPRLLREMASTTGKPVEFVVEGGDTEADKAIVEMLFEPLLHVLRNAMDHGIEDAPTRRARNKPAVATVLLRAERSGNQVVVEVRDDGRGIDVARVRSVAVSKGMMTAEAGAALGEDELVDLIFEPGFSTSDHVTDVSGRGVGMDAVRTAVHRVGGRVGIASDFGRGTTVRFTLPFSVMMTRVMVVSAAGQRFGVPLDAVVETLRVDTDRLAWVGAGQAIALRNRTVPVVSLAEALKLPQVHGAESHATLVVAARRASYGALRVDAVGEPMEVMLKPLEGLLSGMRGLAGSTLLGDGTVLLILDVEELLQ